MKVILEVLSALAASMAIVNTEDLQLGPLVRRNSWSLLCRLYHIKDNRDPILISLAHDSNIGVGSECLNRAKGFGADLACLEKGQRRLRLIFLQKLGHGGFDALRGKLCLGALLGHTALGHLGQHCCTHHNSEGGSLA